MSKIAKRLAKNKQQTGQTEAILLTIAKCCHEANRAYCKALGDDSQLPWEEAPEWQKASCIQGVAFSVTNPEAGPDEGHKSWLAEKKAEGWVYGKEKDEEKKTHPCIVPFHRLPAEQQAKDYIFQAIVRSLV